MFGGAAGSALGSSHGWAHWMGEDITEPDLRKAVRDGSVVVRGVVLVEGDDGRFTGFVRVAGQPLWRRVVLGYRGRAPKRWSQYHTVSAMLADLGYDGWRCVIPSRNPRAARFCA